MSTQILVDDLKAIHAVLEGGWCKYALEDSQGRHCLLGAIGLVTTGSAFEWNRRSGDVYEVVWPFLPEKFHLMDDFNNADETTLGDVLGLFDKALESMAVAA